MSGAHTSFISSTYWTESVGPVAALATISKLSRVDAPSHVARIGNRVMEHWRRHAQRHGLPVITGENFPCFAMFRFQHEQADALRTLYTQCRRAG
jgi:glutamate-1-semialdehyde 2,1-aminomutase